MGTRTFAAHSRLQGLIMEKSALFTVLIVDDEEYIRSMAAHVLEEEGFEVLQAASTAEALKAASDGKVDVVLTDLNMPGAIDGLQLAAIIRRE